MQQLTEEEISREVERIEANRDARRKAAADESEAHVLRTLKRRLQEFREGRRGMCSCRSCLTGYVAEDVTRLCRNGAQQFWQDANQWTPWTP